MLFCCLIFFLCTYFFVWHVALHAFGDYPCRLKKTIHVLHVSLVSLIYTSVCANIFVATSIKKNYQVTMSRKLFIRRLSHIFLSLFIEGTYPEKLNYFYNLCTVLFLITGVIRSNFVSCTFYLHVDIVTHINFAKIFSLIIAGGLTNNTNHVSYLICISIIFHSFFLTSTF